MNFTKKIDRAFQWAGEKMGSEAKTSVSDDFKNLETEMALRYDGMERLQRSMTAYVKWAGRRNEVFEDREKGLPISYLGRTMVAHGEDFEPNSEFGNCLISFGRANERLGSAQEQFVADATAVWLESLDRSLAMMKEYQAARKKLENRRLAYDASITKMQKAKRGADDFRIEEELRTNRAKYEESNEDVMRRMQDIRDAEADSIRDLTGFLDSELDYHERSLEELRRVKRSWPGAATAASAGAPRPTITATAPAAEAAPASNSGPAPIYTARSRSNTAHSYSERFASKNHIEEEPEPPLPARVPIRSRSNSNRLGVNGANTINSVNGSPPDRPPRPTASLGRANSYQAGPRGGAVSSGINTPPPMISSNSSSASLSLASTSTSAGTSNAAAAALVSTLRSGLRPVMNRAQTNASNTANVFEDNTPDDNSNTANPDWADRSASPATSSYGSLSRSTSQSNVLSGQTGARKPPPPPPSRSKKPPPPPPMKREVGY